jgi:hypothetical protein
MLHKVVENNWEHDQWMIIHFLAAVAGPEREAISERTKAALAATRRAESDWARGPQGATGATCGQFLPNISGHPRRRYGEPKGLTAWDQDFDQFVTPRAQQFAFPKIRV